MDKDFVPLDDYQHFFYCEDFDEAVALNARDYSVVDIDSTKSRSTFIFENRDEITKASKDYWSDRLMVSALKLASARRSLKSRLYRSRPRF